MKPYFFSSFYINILSHTVSNNNTKTRYRNRRSKNNNNNNNSNNSNYNNFTLYNTRISI